MYKTALIIAVNKQNVEIVQLLLQHPDIDVNAKAILKDFYFYKILTALFESCS